MQIVDSLVSNHHIEAPKVSEIYICFYVTLKCIGILDFLFLFFMGVWNSFCRVCAQNILSLGLQLSLLGQNSTCMNDLLGCPVIAFLLSCRLGFSWKIGLTVSFSLFLFFCLELYIVVCCFKEILTESTLFWF